MSLHAQLSPEAIEQLRLQKRNGSIGSLIIGLLVVSLLALITGLLMIPMAPKVHDGGIAYVYKVEKKKPPVNPIKPKQVIKKKQVAPSTNALKLIHSIAPAPLEITVPDVPVPDISPEIGNGRDFGDSTGFTPTAFCCAPPIRHVPGRRCSPQDRKERLDKTGGTMAGERAVVRALDYLQRTQNDDGSWGNQYQAAMTGFAILAYMGHCEHPYSQKYGDTVSRGLTYLIDLGMKNDGKLTVSGLNGHQWVYEHAICTYALAEAQTFCKGLDRPFPKLKETTKKAGELIMDGQADSGGWNYKYANSPSAGDNSVGFWQIQALKACKLTGIWNEAKFDRTARKAIEFLEKVQGEDGAIGYRTNSNKSPQLTGGGVLCMQIWGEGDSRSAKKGIDWIRKNSKFQWGQTSANLYYHYYQAQAMINAGGEDWEWYNAMFRDQLIDAQKDDGSWNQRMQHGPINEHMATCLATLTLEVYYRFLPSSEQ